MHLIGNPPIYSNNNLACRLIGIAIAFRYAIMLKSSAISNDVDCTVTAVSIVSTFKCIDGVGSYYQTDKKTGVGD